MISKSCVPYATVLTNVLSWKKRHGIWKEKPSNICMCISSNRRGRMNSTAEIYQKKKRQNKNNKKKRQKGKDMHFRKYNLLRTSFGKFLWGSISRQTNVLIYGFFSVSTQCCQKFTRSVCFSLLLSSSVLFWFIHFFLL